MNFDWQAIGTIAAVAAVIITLGRDAVNGSWKLGKYLSAMEGRLSKKIDDNKSAADIALSQMEAELEKRIREVEAEIHKIETWSRDEFVRKQSFEFALGRIEKVLEKLDAKLDAYRGLPSSPSAHG